LVQDKPGDDKVEASHLVRERERIPNHEARTAIGDGGLRVCDRSFGWVNALR
jgi:hypothetical protein